MCCHAYFVVKMGIVIGRAKLSLSCHGMDKIVNNNSVKGIPYRQPRPPAAYLQIQMLLCLHPPTYLKQSRLGNFCLDNKDVPYSPDGPCPELSPENMAILCKEGSRRKRGKREEPKI